jgi:hypothetical protein
LALIIRHKKLSLPQFIFQSPGSETNTISYNVIDPNVRCGELYLQFADRFAPIVGRIGIHPGYTKYIVFVAVPF